MSNERPLRVISLLPGATDILTALGAADLIVGVTHECDVPVWYRREIARVTSSHIHAGTPGEIDQAVRSASAQGNPLFELDESHIAALAPDVILTQALCDVCAVDENDVRALAKRLAPSPNVVTLNGTTFESVFDDIARVAEAIGMPEEGEELIAGLRTRLVKASPDMTITTPVRVAVIEWTDPIYVAGHWVPEIVRYAGGVDVLAQPGTHSVVHTMDDIRRSQPEILLIAPCGYSEPQAEAEIERLRAQDAWAWAAAVPMIPIDANLLTSRPGPGIVRAVEVLAPRLRGARIGA